MTRVLALTTDDGSTYYTADAERIGKRKRHQEAYDSHNKLNNLLKAIGVKLEGVNW